ncbi:MAG: PP2C family protein-serine/threonine phosphatase [Planctomycetota bacterium]
MSDTGEQSEETASGSGLSLRLKLLIGVNAAMVLVLTGFLVWDYFSTWNGQLRTLSKALDEEAEVLIAAVLPSREEPEVVRRLIDGVCDRIRSSISPGHHIAVRAGDYTVQSHAGQPDSEQVLQAMVGAGGSDGTVGRAPDGDLAVGMAERAGITVYVSEYLDNVKRLLRGRILRHSLSMLLLGLSLGAVVNLLIARLVTDPLDQVVDAVKRLKGGDLGVQAPEGVSAEIDFLSSAFNSMSSTLARAQRERSEAMQKARRIQERLLSPVPQDIGLGVASCYQPAQDVAGDQLDIWHNGDDRVVFCVADAAGHGVAAALMAGMLKTLFTAGCEEDEDPGAILRSVNRGFVSVTLEEDFASMFVVSLEPGTGAIRYSSAGHEPAYLLAPEPDAEPLRLDAMGPPVGIVQEAEWPDASVECVPGSRLVMLTDGLPEARSEDGEFFGRDRLLRLLGETRDLTAQEVCDRILDDVAAHSHGTPQADDITVLIVDF